MPIDIHQIRSAVLKKHNIAIDSDDPILVTALLCDEVISHAVVELATIVEASRNENAALLGQITKHSKEMADEHIVTAKKVAEELVSQGGQYIKDNIEKSFENATVQLLSKLDSYAREMDGRLKTSTMQARISIGCTILSLLALIGSVGLLVCHKLS